MNLSTFRPLLVCGASGVGKGTILKEFLSRNNQKFGFSVSSTTRKPRPGEIHGVHYNFMTKDEFQLDITNGKFIEYAEVHGNFYGTTIMAVTELQSKKKHPIFDIDIQGAESIIKYGLNPLAIFINPPSFPELRKRLELRGTETVESMNLRLENAKKEMLFAVGSGYFHIIINKDFQTCVKEFEEYVAANI